jgi:choline kinase
LISASKLEGLILAAGYSSRFNFRDRRFCKYFLKLNNSSILGYIIAGMIKAGIKKITIVTSKILPERQNRKGILKSIAMPLIDSKNIELIIIENENPKRENGYSLSLGLRTISSEYTLLAMADHIFSKNVFSKLIKSYNKKDILLATDPMYNKGYCDKDDATKVYGDKTLIIKIGKDLMNYNRLDMGVFMLKTKKIKKICKEVESNFDKFGVSEIIRSALNSDLNIGYSDFPNTIWLDIDDRKKYRQLKRVFNKTSSLHPFGIIPTDHTVFNKKITEVNNY